MPDSIDPKQLTRQPRARLLAVATLLSGVLVAGCGGSSPSPTAANAGAGTITGPSAATSAGAASSGSTVPGAGSPGLAFAECMRSNGVPSFPDPSPGPGLLFSATGLNPSSPAFKVAQAKCKKLLPGGGPPGPGTTTHPSARTLAKLVRIARCMRQHGVPQFPDPRTSVPSNLAGIDEITDFDGVILLFPATLNLRAPAYRQALTACGAPPLGLRH